MKENMGRLSKERWANPEIRKNMLDKINKAWQNPKLRKQVSESEKRTKGRMKKQNQNGKIYGSKTKLYSDEWKEKMSIMSKARWADPELRAKLSAIRKKQGNFRKGTKHNLETKKKMSIAAKKRWQNKEYIEHLKKGMNIKPTKPEKFLINFLNNNFPNEWKYTGDWSFWIENRNPDFINCNGKKALIEFDGDYWHNLSNVALKDKERNQIYAKYGFKILSIKYEDITDEKILREKITNFINSE